MRPVHRFASATFLTTTVLVALSFVLAERAAGDVAISHGGLTIHVLQRPFTGETSSLRNTGAEVRSLEQLPVLMSGFPVLEYETGVVACTDEPGVLTFWTRQHDRLTRQGEVCLSSVSPASQIRIVQDPKYGVAIDFSDREQGLRQLVALSRDGILAIRQPPGRAVSVRCSLRYALVPSLVGTDLLYDPATLVAEVSYLVSLNMVVGLQRGNAGMLTAVWPRGEQLVRVRCEQPKSGDPTIESFELDTAGQPVYISFLHHPGVWHAERLRDVYLETDTPIRWQKPFDARWIGRFFIDSDGYDFPFYFLNQRHKLWGRYIRGWFYYPVWFDGDQTMVHFEKKFPPVGDLLIYHLDTYDDQRLSPVAVMQKSLGEEVAASLLDFAGTREQELLPHRQAVCAMTDKIESFFAQQAGAAPWAEVMQYTEDIATFIRLIRQRVFQFDQFAVGLQELLQARKQDQPGLADSLVLCEEILAEMRDIVAADLPETSLEEVSQWTGDMRRLMPDDKGQSLGAVKALTQKCRSVAGTQDDMARNLSVVTIRLMEEAARMGTASPVHARVAEEIIGQCRQILRQPTWWEPCRRYAPKSNPGAPESVE